MKRCIITVRFEDDVKPIYKEGRVQSELTATDMADNEENVKRLADQMVVELFRQVRDDVR